MAKRAKLEIMRDILKTIHDNHGKIKYTPLLRKSNLSTKGFLEYKDELIGKELIEESEVKNSKFISITLKGERFLEKYRSIISFLEEFDL